jgi:hypothetical protein
VANLAGGKFAASDVDTLFKNKTLQHKVKIRSKKINLNIFSK